MRYLRAIDFNGMLRRHLGGVRLRGDFGFVAMIRLVIGLVIVGGRRLRHVSYLKGDPVFARFCGLADLPSARTVSRWLKTFRAHSVERLRLLNALIVAHVVLRLPLRTLTIDVDGTVVSTGLTVERARRGYNPHHRRVPSYYPITGYLAETGHVLRVKNRSGNVSDGKAGVPFLKDLLRQIDQTLGKGYRLNFRMDGAFFREDVISLVEKHNAGFAIKVPFYEWLGLKAMVQTRKRWKRVTEDVEFFEDAIPLTPWNSYLRVAIYRKKVRHKSPKNYQLDLFDPNDGYYEYSAIGSNLSLSAVKLWHFMCGRGAHEKMIGELKTGLAFDSIPTHHYSANSAWQQLVALAHNLLVNFQIEAGAQKKPRSRKRTALYILRSVQTLRFEVFNRAGQIVRPNGLSILRLAANEAIKRRLLQLALGLAHAA